MDMKLDKEIKDRLLKIDWLNNCGRHDILELSNEYSYIKKTAEIEKMIDGVKWANRCMNARNELTSFLSLHYIDRYHYWNPMVDEAKDDVIANVCQMIMERCEDLKMPLKIVDYIKMDIVNIALTYSYKKYYESAFFVDMLKIYESGHLPCGWLGSYKSGKFKVY